MNNQHVAIRTSTPLQRDRAFVVRIAGTIPGTVAIGELPAVAQATRSQVPDSATDVLLIPADATRKTWSVFNDSTAVLYLAMGFTAASTTNYTAQLQPGGYYEPPSGAYFNQTPVRGIWASAPGTGGAKITEGF